MFENCLNQFSFILIPDGKSLLKVVTNMLMQRSTLFVMILNSFISER